MCWRLNCRLFAAGEQDLREGSGDDITSILIFGVTGMTGGAVMEAALGCAWFRVTGFTRTSAGEAYEDLISKGVTVVTGDMNKPKTIEDAMKDIDCVFLNTTYWDSMNVDREYQQGYNVVNAAIQGGVKHVIFVGTDYSIMTSRERCKYLEGKSKVENYIVTIGIPFTVVHLGFYFENFLSVFKPHQTGKNEFAIALPMGNTPLNCGSVIDFGHCIAKVALRPDTYVYKTLKLSTAYLTVSEIANKFDTHFPNIRFYNPQIPLKAYREFDFEGAEELASMFAHYRTMTEWDRNLAYELNTYNKSLDQWLKDNEKVLTEALYSNQLEERFEEQETIREAAVGLKEKVMDSLPLRFFFGHRIADTSRKMDVTSLVSTPQNKRALNAQETERHFQRRTNFNAISFRPAEREFKHTPKTISVNRKDSNV